MRYASYAATVLLFMAPNAHSSEEPGYWRVPTAQAACIQSNVEKYATQTSDPIVIVVNACPEPDTVKALSKVTQNTGTTMAKEGDSVIILSREELSCLSKLALSADEAGMVLIPKRVPCE